MRYMWTLSIITLVGCAPNALGAQDVPDSTLSCPDAARIARSHGPAAARKEAVVRIGGCQNEFGDVIPVLWQDASTDGEVFDEVREVSLRINDRRVFQAATDAAGDGSLSSDRRLAALEVLAHYVDPTIGITRETLANPPRNATPRTSLHATMRAGSQPVPQEEANRALETFSVLSAGGGAGDILRAAKYLRQAFAWQRPEVTPLRPGAISATLDCQGHFRMENGGDVDLPVTVADSAGHTLRTFDLLAATSPGARPVMLTFATPGPFTLRLRERVIQTLRCQ